MTVNSTGHVFVQNSSQGQEVRVVGIRASISSAILTVVALVAAFPIAGHCDEGAATTVTIPGGTFVMGAEVEADHQPPHEVTVDKFLMDRHEVTNAEYAAFCAAKGRNLPEFWGIDELRSGPDFPAHPVVGVSWRDAADYCAWRGMRLPTEAEWEWAARGGLEDKKWPWGDEIDPRKANYNPSDGLEPVGSYPPNGYGLYDMAGNTAEWVADWYDPEYYAVSPPLNPKGPEKAKYRSVRGGGWHSGPYCTRVYRRLGLLAYWVDINLGFRCAGDAPQPEPSPSTDASAAEIHDAAANGDLDAVKALVAADPERVNSRDVRGMTPLHVAARGVHPEIVRYLVGHGADVNAKDANEVTALHSLAHRGEDELAALLIARGADPAATLLDGRAAIHLAVEAGHTAVVEVLLGKGVDADTANSMGSSPLLLASSAGLEDMVERLIEHGANVNQPNSRGDTPITVAHREEQSTIVELLTARGADADGLAELTMPNGPYLGQQAPGKRAALFAPSVVSTEQSQLNAVFSPDGREFYYTQVTSTGSVIMEMRLGAEGWSRPLRASFSDGSRNVDHYMTRDGQRMFFCSLRSVDDAEALQQHADFWVAERTDDGWSEPRRLSETVNSDADDYYPTLTDDGTLVFSSRRAGGLGGSDLYLARFSNGVWVPPENFGPPVNTQHTEHDPFIAPDGSYVIFASDRPGGHGSTDLYVSYAGENGQWSEPRNLGPEINSNGRDFTPMLSQDGRYLFFTSSRAGAGDIYWVDAKVIEEIRPR